MESTQRDLLATAYHEAGHAVIAWCEGIQIRKASVIAGDGVDGSVTHAHLLVRDHPDSTRSESNRLKAERHVRVYLAGHLAQRRYDCKSVRPWHAERDRHEAVDLLSHFVTSDRELSAWLRLLDIQTQQRLRLHWPLVRALATELVKRKQMSGRAIRALLSREV